jgi:hypothetical protein
MQNVLRLCTPMLLLASGVSATPRGTKQPVSPSSRKSRVPTSYSLNAVSPGATGSWSFYAAAAGETSTKNYLPVIPGIDAANTVRVVAEPNPPYRPVMEWEYGYSAGLITVRPESDRNTSIKKGDLIAMWKAPSKGKYEVQIDIDNAGNDALGGDGGTLTVSRLPVRGENDTQVMERIPIPASGHESPHVKRIVPVEAGAGERIVMRLNAGIDGFADLWHLRYIIARAPLSLPKEP